MGINLSNLLPLKQVHFNLLDEMKLAFAFYELIFDDKDIKSSNILLANDFFYETLNQSCDNRDILQIENILSNPDDFKIALLYSMENNQPCHFHDDCKQPDKLYDITAIPMENKIIIMMSDITEHKSKDIDYLLKDSEDKYKQIIESIEEGFYELDLKGKITFFNKSLEKILNKDKSKIFHLKYSDYLDEKSAEDALAFFKDIYFGRRERGENIWLNIKKGNEEKFVEVSADIKKEGDEISGFRGIVRDVTDRKKAELALLESEKKYRELVDTLPEMVFELDKKGDFTYVNKRASKLLGYSFNEFMAMSSFDILGKRDLARAKSGADRTLAGEHFLAKEFVLTTKFKKEIPVYLYTNPIFNNKKIVGMRGIAVDISEIVKAENALRQSREKYKSLYDNALVAMLTTEVDSGKIVACNELCYKLYGYENKADFIANINIKNQYVNQTVRGSILRALQASGEIHHVEVEFLKKDQSTFWAELKSTITEDGKFVESVILDITKRKDAEKMIHALTYYDNLTGLPNKGLFKTLIQAEIMRAKKVEKDYIFTVVCAGIDDFKNINNVYTPQIGDEILQTLAIRLEKSFYRKDDKLCRFDGDKFMILFSNIGTIDDAGTIVKNIEDIFTEPIVIGDEKIDISASLGVSLYPKDGENPDVLVKNSESAMYIAKERRRGTYYFFNKRLNKKIVNRFELELKLKRAMKNNQFFSFFQPKVSFDGKIVGMESLVRWKTATGKIILPSEFVSIAEKNGLIVDLGYDILKQACIATKKWHDEGFDHIKVAVNLSPVQFKQKDLIRQIEKIIGSIGLNPAALELEITESGLMENEQDAISKLKELRKNGFSIAIDDFGTAYSSLNKLQDYPIDTLKIDKSFVDNIFLNEKTASITKYTINLAHDLGFKVVAEGVEEKQQVDFLKSHDCDIFQGFYFDKPLSKDDFDLRLRV